jgi:hypothetical protein
MNENEEEREKYERKSNIIIAVVVVVILALAISCVFFSTKERIRRENQPCEVEREAYLKAIKLDDGFEGRFYIMSGLVKDVLVYDYYEIVKDGVYLVNRVPAQVALIDENLAEGEKPYVTIMKGSPCALPKELGNNLNGNWYIFHVPKGSVKETTDVSLP